MFLDEHALDQNAQLPDKQLIAVFFPKKPYLAPKLIPILGLDILNNMNGGGDGDAALAHS